MHNPTVPMANYSVVLPSSMISIATKARRPSELCPVHPTRRGDLFCVTCELPICSKCLVDSREHVRHVFRTLKDVYTKRFQETLVKLDTLNRYIISQWRNAEFREELLGKLNRNQAFLIDRLDRIIYEAKAEVLDRSYKKSIELDPAMLVVRLKNYYGYKMQEEIYALSEGEFLAQQKDLNYRCDSLMSTPVHCALADPEDSCTLSCSLLPSIEMNLYRISIESKSNLDISYVDRYGNRWNLELEIKDQISTLPAICADKLMLNVQVEGSGKPGGNYLMVVEVLNDIPWKNITQRTQFKAFGLPDSRKISTEIAGLLHLQNEGFITKEDRLQIKVGIGPEDPITERKCYQQALEKCRSEICSLKNQLTDWKQFTISYFHVEKCLTLASHGQKPCSTLIMDERGVKWQLKVSINTKPNKGFLGVSLIKSNGSKGWYDYFVELMHPKGEQHHRIVKGWHLFDNGVGLLELPQYLAMAFVDPFLDGGTLRLRFGTRKEE